MIRLLIFAFFCAAAAQAAITAVATASSGTNALYTPVALRGDASTGGGTNFFWEQQSGNSNDFTLIGQDRSVAMLLSASVPSTNVFRLYVSNATESATQDVTVIFRDTTPTIYYLDGNIGGTNLLSNTYDPATRGYAASGGQNAYGSVSNLMAAGVLNSNVTLLVRGGLYQTYTQALNPQIFFSVTNSGTVLSPLRIMAYTNEAPVLVGRGFSDADDGSGKATGPTNGNANEALFVVRGDYVQVFGLTFSNSAMSGAWTEGDWNYWQECRSRHNWGLGFLIFNSADDGRVIQQGNVMRWCEADHNRHSGGFEVNVDSYSYGGTHGLSTLLVHADSLSWSNGFDATGTKVLPILIAPTDTDGGGNSDGFVYGKDFESYTNSTPTTNSFAPTNFCVGAIALGNADDGIDLNCADSLLENSIAAWSGPSGRQGLKNFIEVRGLVVRGNTTWSNDERGFEVRLDLSYAAHPSYLANNTAAKHQSWGLPLSATNVVGKNNVAAWNALAANSDMEFANNYPDLRNWARDGVNAPNATYTGDPKFANTNLPPIAMEGLTGTIRSKVAQVRAHFATYLTPQSDSGLVDAGLFIPGYHCPRADDDPTAPMPTNAPGKHWFGSAPDIGAWEFGTPAEGEPPAPSSRSHAQRFSTRGGKL